MTRPLYSECEMTRVEIHFDLERPLDERLLEALTAAHGIYGMERIVPAPDLQHLRVDYDASRLTVAEVEAALRGAGIPVRAPAAAPGV